MSTLREWEPRAIPLEPAAVAAVGKAARGLALRLLEWEEERLTELRGAAGEGYLLLIGEAEKLPWTDGVLYLGKPAEAPALLIPTHSQPMLPLPLLERALRARFPTLFPPLAVLPGQGAVLSAAIARPISRQKLLDWLAEQSDSANIDEGTN